MLQPGNIRIFNQLPLYVNNSLLNTSAYQKLLYSDDFTPGVFKHLELNRTVNFLSPVMISFCSAYIAAAWGRFGNLFQT